VRDAIGPFPRSIVAEFGADPHHAGQTGCDDGAMVRGPGAVQLVVVVVLVGGLAIGAATSGMAWLGPSFSRAGPSAAPAAVALAAGWSLTLAAAATLLSEGRRRRGALLFATAVGWFASDWANPASAPAVVFTLGLLLGHAWPAFLAHAAVDVGALPRLHRAILGIGYVTNVVVLGLIPTATFDPIGARCVRCPDNLLAIANDPGLVVTATRFGFALEALWIVGLVALLVRELARLPRSNRARLAVAKAGAVTALVAAAVNALYSIPRGRLSNDSVDVALWFTAAIGLLGVSGGIGADWLRRRQTRQRVARLALEMAASPAAGELAPALGEMLGDPTLQVGYPLDDGRLVGASGASVTMPISADRATTDVRRGGATVAVLLHRRDLAHDTGRIAEAVDAARLTLENERLDAQSRARLRELQTSRAQIVAAAEAERRRLERDLHDGAQQRLMALAIDLAIARQHAFAGDAFPGDAQLAAVESEVRAALSDLRELAHGIIPRSLAEDGLGAALEELADRAAVPIDLLCLPDARIDRPIEAAAYLVVARATRDPAVRRASVDARLVDQRLTVELMLDVADEIPGSLLVDLEDQCGAVDGTIERRTLPDGRIRFRAEIRCAS
jgi:signal transduction histidine kinase